MRPIVARDLMNDDVLTVTEDLSLHQLARFFAQHRISGAPVTSADDRMVGIVTLIDLVRASLDNDDRNSEYIHDWDPRLADSSTACLIPEDLKVRDVMSRSVHGVAPSAEVPEIADLLLRHHLHRVPVIDRGRLIGIVSSSDLLGLLVRER